MQTECGSATEPMMAAAASVAYLNFADLPASAIAMAKNCVLDTLGVAIAARDEPALEILSSTLEESGGQSTTLGSNHLVSALNAAMLNGVAAHALDFDDLSKSAMGGHPSAPLLPAVLAAGETLEITGEQLITAFVAGYELEARLGTAVGVDHIERGFHATATMGAFGAAAGAGHVLGLDHSQMMTALSLAAAQASGMKVMFGSMGKPFQVGKAAYSGLLAAQLSAKGFTAPNEAAGGQGGFGSMYSGAFDPTALLEPFASHWYVTETLYKEHASCYGTHAAIDALNQMHHKIPAPDQIASITLRVPPGHSTVCAIENPQNGLQAKFSLAYNAALAVARGEAGPGQFTADAVADQQLRDLAARVELIYDEMIPELGTDVTVTDTHGKTYEASVDSIADGLARSPEEHWARLEPKFRALVEPILGSEAAESIIRVVSNLENLNDLRELTNHTRPRSNA